MATTVLLRLAALAGESRYRSAAERALAPVLDIAGRHPSGFAQWLLAYGLASNPIDEIAIIGQPHAADTQALLAAARSRYRPGQVIAVSADPASTVVPLLRDRSMVEGAATAYVCRGFACRQPTTDPDTLARQLESASAS